MSYRRFVAYNVVGGFLWVFSMILAGYFLGTVVENALGVRLEDHIEKVVVVVVALSLLPPVIEYLKARREKRLARAREAGGAQV
jgi:membrane-associated protein